MKRRKALKITGILTALAAFFRPKAPAKMMPCVSGPPPTPSKKFSPELERALEQPDESISSGGTARDRNGVEIRVHDFVRVFQEEETRIARVADLLQDNGPCLTENESGHWIDIDFGDGLQGMMSYICEVFYPERLVLTEDYRPYEGHKDWALPAGTEFERLEMTGFGNQYRTLNNFLLFGGLKHRFFYDFQEIASICKQG